jgi:DNA-binding IclR family transcriptional regulator
VQNAAVAKMMCMSGATDGYGGRVRGVGRAAEVLDLFTVERPYWGPTEVAAEVGVAKSSAHELLRELSRSGLLERMACGKYRLGWRLVGLARTMLQSNGHSTTVVPAAQALASQLGETVHLAALDRDTVLYAASVVPAGGVAAPTAPVDADMTPLGQVLSTGHSGVVVGPQRALDGVTCAAAAVRLRDEPAGSLGVCATNERFAARREVYARALGATQERLARGVRL